MSERYQTLMRTRCPDCGTVFRVTSEQLRVRLGKVRCGHCQSIFNAFDALVTVEVQSEHLLHEVDDESCQFSRAATASLEKLGTVDSMDSEHVPEPAAELAPEPEIRELRVESIEESSLAAREAGLVAARELTDTVAYNRWAEGTLAGGSLGAFAPEANRSIVWPYALVLVLLIAALFSQIGMYFRTELVQRQPVFSRLFEAVAVDVPLPKNSELVTIEASDLQSDKARGLLVLQATLRNRATYMQALPSLELTLTDTQDAVLARRVLSAGEYLSLANGMPNFTANAEFAVRLWIEAKEIGAAGYRLYIFYP